MMAKGAGRGIAVHKNQWGSVSPYKRHTSACSKAGEDEECGCSWWLYVNQRGEKPRRYSLSTPSFAEATRMAADVLRGFDPELAGFRAAKVVSTRKKKTVAEACQLWIARSETRSQKKRETSTLPSYRTLCQHLENWASAHGFEHIQDITPVDLASWQASSDWTDLAVSTQNQRWGVLRSFFSYMHELKVIDSDPIKGLKAVKVDDDFLQGPYTEEQVEAVLKCAAAFTPTGLDDTERDFYAPRLTAFINLLLHTGCDVIDAVLFEPSRIRDEKLGGQTIPVYRYKRTKTKVSAVIPLDSEVASLLRSVPCKNNKASMPFRGTNTDLNSDRKTWSLRVSKCLNAAGVDEVEIPGDDLDGETRSKDANAKQFRHTFAVRQLIAGQREEDVAKMLGHSNTNMIKKHYAPWVKKLDEAHVRRVFEVRAGA